jgi:hypothetical protein
MYRILGYRCEFNTHFAQTPTDDFCNGGRKIIRM